MHEKVHQIGCVPRHCPAKQVRQDLVVIDTTLVMVSTGIENNTDGHNRVTNRQIIRAPTADSRQVTLQQSRHVTL